MGQTYHGRHRMSKGWVVEIGPVAVCPCLEGVGETGNRIGRRAREETHPVAGCTLVNA